MLISQVGEFPGEEPGRKAASRRGVVRAGRWNRLTVDVHPDGLVSAYLGDDPEPVVWYTFGGVVSGSAGLGAAGARADFDDFAAWDETVLP